MIETRRAGPDDLRPASEVLGEAFADYPWTRWTVDPDDHQARITRLQLLALENLGMAFGEVWLSGYMRDDPLCAARIGVVSNTRGAAVLAADACGDVGLQVAALGADSQRALRDLLGHEALVAGPVDTTGWSRPAGSAAAWSLSASTRAWTRCWR